MRSRRFRSCSSSCSSSSRQRIEPVLQEVGQEKGLHFIFNGPDSGLVWADTGLDISTDVIRSRPRRRRSRRLRRRNRRWHPPSHPAGERRESPAFSIASASRYPSLLVDAIDEHEPGRRIVAVKNVTVNEEFFQGHFPGAPLMPGVLMIEALDAGGDAAAARARPMASVRPRVAARRRQREVPQAGRARRPLASRGRRSIAARRDSSAPARWPTSTARWSPRRSWCWRSTTDCGDDRPAGARRIRAPTLAPARTSGRTP